jgi:hypothetical protein
MGVARRFGRPAPALDHSAIVAATTISILFTSSIPTFVVMLHPNAHHRN